MVGGELRTAAATYTNFEFWPGPLDANGEPASGDSCSVYDRIWAVSRLDVADYEETGRASADLAEWPAHLGAPVLPPPGNGKDDDGDGLVDEGTDGIDNDGDGVVDEADEQELRRDGRYDLEEGDRPFLIGDEAAWWIMNDVGNVHNNTETPPIGLEVRVHAFAFHGDGHLGNATFFKYELSKRGAEPLEDAYFSIWSDPDLGSASDDYVGMDTTLDLGYVYNARPTDLEYGTPPAFGFDFLRGPVSDAGDMLRAASFMSIWDGGPLGTEDPHLGEEIYNVQQGRWRRGDPITEGGLGFRTGGDTTTFMFAGDPVTGSFWSEVNTDGEGIGNQPGDRWMILSLGPFSIRPDEQQDVVVGLLWARGADHLDSVTELRQASTDLQEFVDRGYAPRPNVSPPAAAPDLVTPADGAPAQPTNVMVRWTHVSDAVEYELQIASTPDWNDSEIYRTYEASRALSVGSEASYYWRIRGLNAGGYGPWSPALQFATSEVELRPSGPLRLSSGQPAFVEIDGPNGEDPCGPDAVSPDGCDEIGANAIYGSINSTGDFYTYSPSETLEQSIARHAPHTFEIRFTERGSYGASIYTTAEVYRVPFEVWDIGPVAPSETNDESDDIQLIPTTTSSCPFAYGDHSTDPLEYGWTGTDQIYAEFPATTYEEWASFAEEELAGDICHTEVPHDVLWSYINTDLRYPVRRLVIYGNPEGPNYRAVGPSVGTVLRFYSRVGTPPVPSSPADGAASLAQPISFWWNSFDGATAFHLQLDADESFASPILDADTLSDPTFVAGPLQEGTYVWRVRAENPAGGWTAWSEPWTFSAAGGVQAEHRVELPTSAVLASNYPNPFNPTTTIRYGLPRSGDVRIEVFDLLGRRLAVLLDRAMPAGWHRLEWNAANVSSGTYFIRLAAGGDSDVRQVVLLR